jgi:hypothetical protein
MSPAPILSNGSQQNPESKKLSIEIEPSYPLLMAITEFFRAQKKPQQSLDLCRLGLNYFPGDIGLRLSLALSYLDLTEKDKAWMEIKTVVQELNQLAPILESISNYFQHNDQNKLSEWFHQLSLALSKYPEEEPVRKVDSPIPSLFPEKEFQPGGDSDILENSSLGILETKTFAQIAKEEISLLSPGKNKEEKESSKEALPESNILSTLTGWLSQLKESKA